MGNFAQTYGIAKRVETPAGEGTWEPLAGVQIPLSVTLEVAENGEITGYKMRVEKSKYATVKALQSIGYETIAAGDSYNDLGMIKASKAGFLFKSTDKIKADNPDLPAYETYADLLSAIKAVLD